MDHRYENFVYDILDIFSRYSKTLQDICEKYKSPSYVPGDDDDTPKAKKPVKKKVVDPLKGDPNAPKKPVMQGYLLYYSEVRSDKQKYPQTFANQDITKMIAEEWNKLPKDKKDHYEVKARMNKQQYEKDLEAYLKTNPKMREAVNLAKGGSASKKPTHSTEESVAIEPVPVPVSVPKAKPAKKKVLASSSDEDDDEDDDAEVKSPSPAKPAAKAAANPRSKAKLRMDIGSDDDDNRIGGSDSDSDRPIKKLKK